MSDRDTHVTVSDDPGGVAERAAMYVAQVLTEAVTTLALTNERTSIALAGGSTPRALYERLVRAGDAIPWKDIDVYFGDERAVPPDDADSNYRMAREALLDRVPVDPARVFRMRGEADDLDAASVEYERLLPAKLTILLLGIGEDGHTASLFPSSTALAEKSRRVVPVVGPKPPPRRLTITPAVIEAASVRCVVATGAGKARVIADILEGPWDPTALPAQLARRGRWFLDAAAASRLTPSSSTENA